MWVRADHHRSSNLQNSDFGIKQCSMYSEGLGRASWVTRGPLSTKVHYTVMFIIRGRVPFTNVPRSLSHDKHDTVIQLCRKNFYSTRF